MKRLRPATLLAMLLLGAALGTTSAQANYDVLECVPRTIPAPDAVLHHEGKIYPSDECLGAGQRAGWGVGLESNGETPNGGWSAWSFTAPAGTYFNSARASVHQDARFGYGALYSGAGGTQSFNDEWSTPTWVDTPYFAVSLRCFASPCSSPGGAGDANLAGGYVFVTNFQAEVVDQHAPTLIASGSVIQSPVARGTQQLHATSSDVGGGVRSINVYVNGTLSASSDFCAPDPRVGVYTTLKPCPSSHSVLFNLDTESDPGWTNGPNDVLICAADVGGNRSPCVSKTVEVDNSCPASGGQAADRLDSGIDSNGKVMTRASMRSTQTPVVRGSLVSGAGQPVRGATVCIYEAIELDDASRELVAQATTQPNGRFATHLDPGPSRTVDVVYRYGDRVLTRGLQIDSSVVPRLRILERRLANGEAAHFRGQLPGPGADSRVVTLQARAGKKWRTFKQLRTNALGAFRGKYPFTQTSGTVRYTFRALVKRQGDYPYEPGSSRKREVLVRG